MMQANQTASLSTADNRLLRLPQVMAQLGLSKSTVYKLVREGKFPAPKKLTERCVAWYAADVAAWIESKVTAA